MSDDDDNDSNKIKIPVDAWKFVFLIIDQRFSPLNFESLSTQIKIDV